MEQAHKDANTIRCSSTSDGYRYYVNTDSGDGKGNWVSTKSTNSNTSSTKRNPVSEDISALLQINYDVYDAVGTSASLLGLGAVAYGNVQVGIGAAVVASGCYYVCAVNAAIQGVRGDITKEEAIAKVTLNVMSGATGGVGKLAAKLGSKAARVLNTSISLSNYLYGRGTRKD